MATNRSYTLPDDLLEFLESEAKEYGVKKSQIIQEELRNRQRRKRKITVNERIVFAFLLVAIGFTIWCFAMLLMPYAGNVSQYIFALMFAGLISVISGYVAFYLIYKQTAIRKKGTVQT